MPKFPKLSELSTEVKAVMLMITVVAGGIIAAITWMDDRYVYAGSYRDYKKRSDYRIEQLEKEQDRINMQKRLEFVESQIVRYETQYSNGIGSAPPSVKKMWKRYQMEYNKLLKDLGY